MGMRWAGPAMMACAAALLAIGVVIVRSAEARIDPAAPMTVAAIAPGGAEAARSALAASAASRTTIYAGLAIATMLIASRFDPRRLGPGAGDGGELRPGVAAAWRGWPIALLVGGALGLQALTLVPGVGVEANGAVRWLGLRVPGLGQVTFQPSEGVKWAMVLGLAWWGAARGRAMRKAATGLGPGLLLLGVGCGLVVLEDLGTAVLIGAVGGVILLGAGGRIWQLAGVGLAGVAAAATMIAQSPFRMDRILAFLDPWADPAGTGYHPIRSMAALAQGGWSGNGLGFGVQKFGYLPEDTTDFIYAIVCEELGLAGAVMVVGLLLAVAWLAWRIGAESGHRFVALAALGVAATLGLQAVINVAVVTVVMPTKGIALPLVSHGGTGWVITAAMLGLLAGADRHGSAEVVDAKKADALADATPGGARLAT
ncbi:MAG: FtsW/RodA/SpoVE family cell cycle protein [Planctomycetota bacterium]